MSQGPIRVKIKGEGLNPWLWKITDQEGRSLPVTRLELAVGANPPSARLRIEVLDFEIEADTGAEVVKICPICRKPIEEPKS